MKTKVLYSFLSFLLMASANAAEDHSISDVIVAYDKYEPESGIYFRGYITAMGVLLELNRDPSCDHLFNQNEKVFCRSSEGAVVQVGVTTEHIPTDSSDGAMKVRWNSNVELQEVIKSNRRWYKLVLKNN